MLKRLTTILALTTLGLTAPLFAQAKTSITPAELDAAVVARPVGNRQAIQSLLATDEAQTLASRMGVSAAELSARVATLDQASVDLLAQRADVDANLVGGANTVVISTTTILIAVLLIIILAS